MLIYMLSFMYKYMHVYSICTVHCKCTLCCCACRFTTASVYYGLTLNATSLAGNDYFDTFLSSEASATPDSHMNLSRILSFAQARSRFRHTCQSSSSTTTSVAGRPPPCCSHLSPPASGRSPPRSGRRRGRPRRAGGCAGRRRPGPRGTPCTARPRARR